MHITYHIYADIYGPRLCVPSARRVTTQRRSACDTAQLCNLLQASRLRVTAIRPSFATAAVVTMQLSPRMGSSVRRHHNGPQSQPTSNAATEERTSGKEHGTPGLQLTNPSLAVTRH